jgi:site-specific DNA-methyltransferase (adenine-specific)
MAPGLVGPEKAARGKLPTDTWWHTIVPPAGKERTGYPNQKPLGILRRIIQASSPPGGIVADFFAGSGTTGAACIELGRRFLLVDSNPEAVQVMAQRFAGVAGVEYTGRQLAEPFSTAPVSKPAEPFSTAPVSEPAEPFCTASVSESDPGAPPSPVEG